MKYGFSVLIFPAVASNLDIFGDDAADNPELVDGVGDIDLVRIAA